MPHMNGIELLRIIRADERLYHIPVLVVSGENSYEYVKYAQEENADGYEIKPFYPDRIGEAIKNILEKRKDRNSLDLAVRTIAFHYSRREYKEALQLATQLAEHTDNPDIYYYGACSFFALGDRENASDWIQKALKLERSSKALCFLARMYTAENNFDQALKILQEARKQNRFNPDIAIEQGELLIRMGRMQEADKLFSNIDPGALTDMSLLKMGLSYLDHDNLEKASRYLLRVKDPLPRTAIVFNKFAIALKKAGRIVDALKQYKRCLELAPDNPVFHLNLANLYLQMGRKQDAARHVEAGLKLDPENEFALQLQKKLQQ